MLIPLAAVAMVLSAAVLLVSGVAKLREPVATRDAFTSLRLPQFLARGPWPVLLPWAEIVLGIALLAIPARAVAIPAALTLGLFLAYWGIIARALRFDEPVRCSCFGKIGDHAVSPRTLLRNTVLVATSVLALVGALRGSDVWWLLSERTWGWLAAAALTAVVVLLSFGGSSASPAAPLGAPSGPALSDTPAVLDDLRTGAPVDLGVAGGPDLLVFLSPGCGPCDRVALRLPQWQEDGVRVAPVYAQGLDQVHQVGGIDPPQSALHDSRGVGAAIGVTGTPAAVRVAADGLLHGPLATGEDHVVELVESVLSGTEPAQSRAQPDDDDYLRRPIPDAVLIAPDREPTTLRELAAFRPVLLIGVNCTCGSTVQTINRLSDWAEQLPEVDLRMLTTFQLPALSGLEDAVYDHESIAWRALGMTASPCAVLLGADGQLAGGPVSGVEEIAAMVNDIDAELAPYRTADGSLSLP